MLPPRDTPLSRAHLITSQPPRSTLCLHLPHLLHCHTLSTSAPCPSYTQCKLMCTRLIGQRIECAPSRTGADATPSVRALPQKEGQAGCPKNRPYLVHSPPSHRSPVP